MSVPLEAGLKVLSPSIQKSYHDKSASESGPPEGFSQDWKLQEAAQVTV